LRCRERRIDRRAGGRACSAWRRSGQWRRTALSVIDLHQVEVLDVDSGVTCEVCSRVVSWVLWSFAIRYLQHIEVYNADGVVIVGVCFAERAHVHVVHAAKESSRASISQSLYVLETPIE
jgi:hypothetical protein